MAETDYEKIPIDEKENEKFEDVTKYGYGVRHVQGLLIFFCLTLCYAARGHLGVSIVAMTDTGTNINKTMHGIGNETLNIFNSTNKYNLEENNATSWTIYRTYHWPKSTQEMVHGSFLLGYSIMMFPGGIICQKWGGKLPLQLATFVNAVVSILTPWIVAWGDWKALCGCRVIQGLSQAGLYPAVHTLLSNWVPVGERGSFSGYVYTGSGLGTVLAFQLGGILAYSRFGWPSTFWFIGVMSFVGFLLLTLFGAPSPAAHKSISTAERQYISGTKRERVQTKSVTPWKLILTSGPAWSTFIAHIGSAVCYIFFYIQIPTYMSAIMKVNIRNNGLLSSLPYIAAIFASMLIGLLSDFLTNRKILSLKNVRKLSSSIATVIPAVSVILVSYTTDTYLAVTCFVLTIVSFSAIHTGWMINYLDLSPNYSGALMAIGNTLSNFLILILPLLVANIVVDVTNQQQWRIMIFLIVGLLVLCNLIFFTFISTELQPWNNIEKVEEDKQTEPEAVKLQEVKS